MLICEKKYLQIESIISLIESDVNYASTFKMEQM